MMKKVASQEIDGLVWLESELLSQFRRLKHAIFLRHGGESTGNFSSLNASFDVGDSKECVRKNRLKMKKALGLKHLISSKQVHGKDVREVSSASFKKEEIADAMVTKCIGIGILAMHADCQAAIFYDPKNHAVAVAHAGWRGSCQNIYKKTVEKMRSCFFSQPEDIHVAISPSLGPSCAEFIHYKKELPQEFWQFQVKPNYFDFWEISNNQLLQCGILPHHIEVSRICTYEEKELYFSYRRDGLTGRHATVAICV